MYVKREWLTKFLLALTLALRIGLKAALSEDVRKTAFSGGLLVGSGGALNSATI